MLLVIFKDLSHGTQFLLFCLFTCFLFQTTAENILLAKYLSQIGATASRLYYTTMNTTTKNLSREKDLLQVNLWDFYINLLDANGLLITITQSWRQRRNIDDVGNSSEDQFMHMFDHRKIDRNESMILVGNKIYCCIDTTVSQS